MPSTQKKSKRRSYVNYYVQGDLCEETKKMRTVNVRLFCSTTLRDGQVALYLEEKKQCEVSVGAAL